MARRQEGSNQPRDRRRSLTRLIIVPALLILICATTPLKVCSQVRDPQQIAARDYGAEENGSVQEVVPRMALTPPWKLTRLTRRARIYLDTSMSMRGYATADSSVFRTFLENLKYALVGSDIERFEVCRVDRQVGKAEDVAQFQGFGDAKSYSGAETNLAAALKDATNWNSGVVLVLTDGIVSLSRSRSPSSSASWPKRALLAPTRPA